MDVSTFNAHRRSLDTPSGEIAYTELGSGPVALFLHGIGTSGLLWRQVIEDVQDTSRCIAVDLPTHGGTPARDDMSVAAMARLVADLCDGLGLTQVDQVAPMLTAIAADPSTWDTSPLAMGYEHPGQVPDEVWRAYLTAAGGTIER